MRPYVCFFLFSICFKSPWAAKNFPDRPPQVLHGLDLGKSENLGVFTSQLGNLGFKFHVPFARPTSVTKAVLFSLPSVAWFGAIHLALVAFFVLPLAPQSK